MKGGKMVPGIRWPCCNPYVEGSCVVGDNGSSGVGDGNGGAGVCWHFAATVKEHGGWGGTQRIAIRSNRRAGPILHALGRLGQYDDRLGWAPDETALTHPPVALMPDSLASDSSLTSTRRHPSSFVSSADSPSSFWRTVHGQRGTARQGQREGGRGAVGFKTFGRESLITLAFSVFCVSSCVVSSVQKVQRGCCVHGS